MIKHNENCTSAGSAEVRGDEEHEAEDMNMDPYEFMNYSILGTV